MIFYALAICVCLAVLFLVMAGISLLCLPLSRIIQPWLRSRPPAIAANLLFALRMLPLFLAACATVGLALPAFLKFEPRGTTEAMGAKLLLLAAAGALVLAVMTVRAALTLRATARVEKLWRANSQEQWANIAGVRVPLYQVDEAVSLLAVVGFFRPRIFVANEIARLLSAEELSAALAHEMAHVRFFDNLKQFLLKITRMPRWLRHSATRSATVNDSAWTDAAELAADQSALSQGASVLDLAAALVKISRLERGGVGVQITASHLLPHARRCALEARVRCLQNVLEGEPASLKAESPRQPWQTICLIILPVLVYIACINAVLPAIHEVLEFLVR